METNISPADVGVVSKRPVLVSPGSGGDGLPLDTAIVAADNAALAALPPNCFVANQVYPGGYMPARSITSGKLADFVVLSDNLLAIDPDAIKDVTVLMTVVGSEIVYEAD